MHQFQVMNVVFRLVKSLLGLPESASRYDDPAVETYRPPSVSRASCHAAPALALRCTASAPRWPPSSLRAAGSSNWSRHTRLNRATAQLGGMRGTGIAPGPLPQAARRTRHLSSTRPPGVLDPHIYASALSARMSASAAMRGVRTTTDYWSTSAAWRIR